MIRKNFQKPDSSIIALVVDDCRMSKNLFCIISSLCLLLSAIAACGGKAAGKKQPEENLTAKKQLQGIWINEDAEDVAFRINGDTLYFPEATSAPVYFRVEKDSFVLYGANTVKYHIIKQSKHLFVFVNQDGDQIRLVKTNDRSYLKMFEHKTAVISVNQNKIIKKDTIIYHNGEKYHTYVQVNPTTYKVVKGTYNDDGVEVDNIYYDNIIHFGLYNGSVKLFSRNLTKNDFKKEVPASFLRQAVFSDMTFQKTDENGIHYLAILAIPDSYSSFIVDVTFSYSGNMSKKVATRQ
mgnify:CR=1 FL=1